MKGRTQGPNPGFYNPPANYNDALPYAKSPYMHALGPSFKESDSKSSLLEQITNLTPNLVAVYNIQTGQYIYINNSLKPLLGYENHEWIDKGVMHVSSKIHPDDLALISEKNQQALKEADDNINSDSNPIIEFEYRIRHADGSYKWLKTYGTVFDRMNSDK